ncbi:uncharacterized protein TNCV_175521 [Trichonephila clavipes]|nr:uncharacterized protein TNCV_175521 [Trichonephila clavipes]
MLFGNFRVLGELWTAEDIPPLTSDQSEKLIVFRERVLSRIHRPCCCLQAEEFLGVPLTPPKKGDAFPTPGRRQCTHKYIMVWDAFWEFPAFWVSYGPREDIPPLTSDQSEKLIVFRERVLSRIHRYQIVACLVTSSSPVPLKTRCVGQRCTLNLSRAETSSRWCGVVVRRDGASSGVVHVT